jgi:hypothetical protein
MSSPTGPQFSPTDPTELRRCASVGRGSPRAAGGTTGQRVHAASAGVRAIQHPVPVAFPLLAPDKRAGAGHAHLGGEIRLLHSHRDPDGRSGLQRFTPLVHRAPGVSSPPAVAHGFSRDAPGQEVAPQWAGCVSKRLRNAGIMAVSWESTEMTGTMTFRMESCAARHAGVSGSEPREENR